MKEQHLCESPCAAWYDCLEKQLKGEGNSSDNS